MVYEPRLAHFGANRVTRVSPSLGGSGTDRRSLSVAGLPALASGTGESQLNIAAHASFILARRSAAKAARETGRAAGGAAPDSTSRRLAGAATDDGPRTATGAVIAARPRRGQIRLRVEQAANGQSRAG
jgi:hypothetical protein